MKIRRPNKKRGGEGRVAREKRRKREGSAREAPFHRSSSIAVYSAAALIFYYVYLLHMHNDHMDTNIRYMHIHPYIYIHTHIYMYVYEIYIERVYTDVYPAVENENGAREEFEKAERLARESLRGPSFSSVR